MANQSIKNAFERMWEHTVSKIDNSAIQSDWNQNDETAKDYIKNRPFYDNSEEFVIAEEQTVTLDSNGTGTITSIDNKYDYLAVDVKYKVEFDGHSFNGTVYEDGDACYHTDFTTENGIDVYIWDCRTITATGLSGDHTIKISIINENIKTIDNKYLGIPVFNGTGEKSIVLNSDINVASGKYSHAEGYETEATAIGAHAEGFRAKATASGAHAEGNTTTASGVNSHAEGYQTEASGIESHAEGKYTIAKGIDQHVQGRYNIEDTDSIYAHIVGNGTMDERSNAHTLDWDGNAWYAGSAEVKSIILKSSTEGSSKRFELTIDDTGTLSIKELV